MNVCLEIVLIRVRSVTTLLTVTVQLVLLSSISLNASVSLFVNMFPVLTARGLCGCRVYTVGVVVD